MGSPPSGYGCEYQLLDAIADQGRKLFFNASGDDVNNSELNNFQLRSLEHNTFLLSQIFYGNSSLAAL